MQVTIYHNPACGTSRNTLAMIRATGIEPVVVEYLKTPLDRDALASLLAALNLSPRQLLRDKEALYAELGLADLQLSDEALIAAIVTHPRLMNRPVVVTPRGARLCRPAERVQALLAPA